jgi:hypothetical protein
VCVLLARELIAYGNPSDVLSAENLQRAQSYKSPFDESAEVCQRPVSSQRSLVTQKAMP